MGASWEALGRLLEALGWLLEALGRVLEASWRPLRGILGPRPKMLGFFNDFSKKSEILGVHLGDVLTSKIAFFRVPRGLPT